MIFTAHFLKRIKKKEKAVHFYNCRNTDNNNQIIEMNK